MAIKVLHVLLIIANLSFGFAEAIEDAPFTSSSTTSMTEEHQHHDTAAHDEDADSHCSECCHLSLNALLPGDISPCLTLAKEHGLDNYVHPLISQTPLTPFRPPIS